MLPDPGKQRQEGRGETGDRVRGPMLERTEVDEHANAGLVGPIVRTTEHLCLDDREVRRELGLLLGRLALGALGALASLAGGGASRRHSEASRSASWACGPANRCRPRRSNQ